MKQSFAPRSRQENLVVRELNNEILIYDLQANKAFCLNETSALIYNLCDGTKSVSEISETIGEKLNSPVTEDFVWLAIDQFKKDSLLINGAEAKPDFNGLSRREAVRKIGLAAVLALPIVTSLVAPSATSAQLGVCSGNCTCSVQNNINLTTGVPCRTIAIGATSDCPSRTTCDCLVTASSFNGTCVGT